MKEIYADVKVMNNTMLCQTPFKLDIPDGKYKISLKDYNSLPKSTKQNALFWSIVEQICKKLNGNTMDKYDLYCQLLEMAGTPHDDILIFEDALERFREEIEHLKVVGKTTNSKGIKCCYCWVFKGLSQMDTKEANQLIDIAYRYASESGIEIEDWKWKALYE